MHVDRHRNVMKFQEGTCNWEIGLIERLFDDKEQLTRVHLVLFARASPCPFFRATDQSNEIGIKGSISLNVYTKCAKIATSGHNRK